MRTISCKILELSSNKKAPQTAGSDKQRGPLLIYAFNHIIPKTLVCFVLPGNSVEHQVFTKLRKMTVLQRMTALKADYTSMRNQQKQPR